ncbi:MAG: dienelactone hydrolase family protein [Propionicimonas sp.]|uniref:alpha/beta hydrolase n=1 Tax=Propionicimonas sp. TaxID=1955623 RepID=UPI003D10DB87
MISARLSEAVGAAGDAPVAVLFLHGFGSNEDDLPGLAPFVAPGLPWASLRAPITLGPSSHAWFEISTPGDPAPEPVVAATDAIWEWVDTNLPEAAAVLPIGFSQGGLMATQLLRTRPERVAGTVVLGGFVLGAGQPADALLAETRPPVFWGRGELDAVITPDAVARTAAWLSAHTTLQARTYPGLAHGINAAEAADVLTFVAQVASVRA